MTDTTGTLYNADMWLPNGTNTYKLTGNVGIGTTAPAGRLQIGTAAFPSPHATYKQQFIGITNIMGRDNAEDSYIGNNIYYSSTPNWRRVVAGGVGLIKFGSIEAGAIQFSNAASGAAQSVPTLIDSLTIRANGNVGIGTTAPGAFKLNVNGLASMTGATLSGDLVMDGGGTAHDITGVDKLTVATIDPLYNLNGVNYATFAPSISGGVKEEYTGKIKINRKNPVTREFEAVVDFSNIEEGSDLWVWRQVVDFNRDNVEVVIAPYGQFAQVYYLIDDNKLIFRSDRAVEISYRLTGRRFDWRNWPTRPLDQSERGIVVE
jgi:hypothetical protein